MHKRKVVLTTLATLFLVGGGIWAIGGMKADAAMPVERINKPVGFEQKTYNVNPAPILKSNTGIKSELQAKKENILNKLKLGPKDKLSSMEMKTWKEYNSTDGENMKNFEVADDRLVWQLKVDRPDGVDTRGGFYRNATVSYVIDAETENVIEMRVHGDLDPQSGPPFGNTATSVIEK